MEKRIIQILDKDDEYETLCWMATTAPKNVIELAIQQTMKVEDDTIEDLLKVLLETGYHTEYLEEMFEPETYAI